MSVGQLMEELSRRPLEEVRAAIIALAVKLA
jgi:hypothetical protein